MEKSKDAKYVSLGHWVRNMRIPYKAIMQRGEKSKWNLSQAGIKRLDDIGFEWMPTTFSRILFEDHIANLLEFRNKYGHCRVPIKESKAEAYFFLGNWVCNLHIPYHTRQCKEVKSQDRIFLKLE